jgi:TrkA domain protein
MPNVQETSLPGVGVRHEFATKGGERVGVLNHRTGNRDLLLYSRNDPDACAKVVRLEEDDARALAELLGASQVAQNLTNLRQEVDGLTIDWMPISPSWSCAGCQVQEMGLRAKTGVVIVAVMRDGQLLPVSAEDFLLVPGDMAVVVGTSESIQQAKNLLQSGDKDTNRP